MSVGLHHCVEILDNIIFELVFVNDIQWDNEMCKWTENMLTIHVCPSSCSVICIEHFWCPGAQDSYWSMIVGIQPGSEYKVKACYISIQFVRSLMGNHLSVIWAKFDLNIEGRQWSSKIHNGQETLFCLFTSVTPLYLLTI